MEPLPAGTGRDARSPAATDIPSNRKRMQESPPRLGHAPNDTTSVLSACTFLSQRNLLRALRPLNVARSRWVQQKSGELHLIRRVIRPGRGHLTSTNLTHVDFPPTLRSGSATFLLFETLSTRTVHRTVSWMCHVVRWDIDCDSHPSSRPAGTAARVIRGLSSTPYRSWVQRPPRTGDVGDDTLQAMGRIGKVVSTLIGHA